MSRIRNFIILLVIIAAALAGGIKGLLYYYTNKAAKDIQNTLPPGMFSYGSISTPLDGKVSINDINIAFAGEIIKIKKVALHSNNILDPIQLMIKNWGNTIPKELGVNIQGINISTSTLFSNRSLLGNKTKIELDIPCGKIKSLGFAEYVEMGYHNFISDLSLSYKIVSSTRIKVDVSLDAKNIIEGQVSYYGELANPLANSTLDKSAKKIIPEFEVQIFNYPLRRKLYNYCASKENKPLDEYIKTVVPYPKELVDQETVNYFQMVLNDETISALDDYDKDPKDLYFALHPKGLISFDELKKMSESVVLDLLRPELRVNGKNVLIRFNWTNKEQLTANKKPTKLAAPVIISSERFLVPFEQLNNKAFNKDIEVLTASGVVYKGAFKRVEGNLLFMNIQTDNGFSEIKLQKSVVRRVFVLNPF